MVMKDSAGNKETEKRRPGRPKLHGTTADRGASYRENNSGHRYDVYLDQNAHQVLRTIMQQTGLSSSKALNMVSVRV